MQICPTCAADIVPGAKFCHRCGDKIAIKTKPCPACQHQSPLSSVFCHHCGFHFETKDGGAEIDYQPKYALDFQPATITEQVKALFFKSLRQRVEEEHDVARYSDYVERFYQSKFREIYAVRAKQIAEDVMTQWERFGRAVLRDIDRRLDDAFEGLLDYFIIQFCPDLNHFILPEGILRYERVQAGKTDLGRMIRDFLDFEREEEVFYFDFIGMPQEYLVNACKSFLFAEQKEKVFFLCDLSLKGNCKEGFALTDRGIYWRASFDKSRKVLYQDIDEIRNGRQWLTINGHFFTANPSLNLKLYKLLKKLRGWPAGAVASR
jgi:hypothetical protein